MKCTPFKICFGMFLLAFVSLFGVSLPVSATNDPTLTLNSSYQTFCDDSDQSLPNCSDYSIVRFLNPDKVYSQYYARFYTLQQGTCTDNSIVTTSSSSGASISAFIEDVDYSYDSNTICKIEVRARNTLEGHDISATLTNPEEQQTCPECEVCQVCPTIPENPYDQKLDAIKIAIYVVAGTMLVIYFFYCIYRMIIKGGKL